MSVCIYIRVCVCVCDIRVFVEECLYDCAVYE